MKPSLFYYRISMAWLIIVVTLSVFLKTTQTHLPFQLNKILQFPYDSFGRNIFTLTGLALFDSLMSSFAIILLLFFLSLFFIFLYQAPWELNSSFKKILQGLIDGLLDWISYLPGFILGLAVGLLLSSPILGLICGSLIQLLPSSVRLIQGQLTYLKQQPYYLQAIATGASPLYLYRHYDIFTLKETFYALWPHWAYRILLLQATFGFLGVGNYPETESWGQLIFVAREYLIEAPWILLGSGMPLLLTIGSLHVLSVYRHR